MTEQDSTTAPVASPQAAPAAQVAMATAYDLSTKQWTDGPTWTTAPTDRSPQIGALALALSRAQGAMEGALKTRDNTMFKNKYADLAAVQEAVRKPFADNELVRIIDPPFGTGTPHAPIPGHFPAKQITDWTPFDDYPEFMEHEELGLEWQFDFSKRQDATVQFECRDLQLPAISLPADVAERIADRCHDGDKLAGWPDWHQGVEYPKCSECGSRMENVIFQLDSEKHLPYMFGDVGRGHVTQCPNHKHVVTFNWACS